jgi:trans-aconitate 2-methyltransferase
MSWSSKQYSKFENERNRPIQDLLARIPTVRVNSAADIGCGPGNSTQLLQERFPGALVTGMDSSADMIAAAKKRLPGVDFELADIATWKNDGPFDIILANAALQWVPNHQQLLPALVAKLAPGGTLAIQMPDNFDEPAHRLMRETAANGPWVGKLSEASRRMNRETAEWYYALLHEQAATLDIWRTTYYHTLTGGPAAIVEWFKGSGLRPYLDPLTQPEREAYLTQYQDAVGKEYTTYSNGSVLLPFPRQFIVVSR